MKKVTSSVKAITIKNRVKELENRLNNLKLLVDNLAFNQEQIVRMLTPEEPPKKA